MATNDCRVGVHGTVRPTEADPGDRMGNFPPSLVDTPTPILDDSLTLYDTPIFEYAPCLVDSLMLYDSLTWLAITPREGTYADGAIADAAVVEAAIAEAAIADTAAAGAAFTGPAFADAAVADPAIDPGTVDVNRYPDRKDKSDRHTDDISEWSELCRELSLGSCSLTGGR